MKSNPSILKSLFLAAIFAISALPSAMALQTDNHGIHAVPAGKVTIDGKLDDWDLSGQILMCYDVLSLKDIYSGRIAMMYDPEALYVSIHWKDPIPMGNSHDPQFQAGKGWAGDCVQLRLKTDRITHLTAWYFAGKNEPFINLDYGKNLNEPFGGGSKNLFRKEGWKLDDGAEMAFLKDEDGKGYVQEMKIPWNLITLDKKYASGDNFRCGIELLWGEADWPIHRYADNLADGTTSREFFWTAKDSWGQVILENSGKLTLPPQPWDNPPGSEKMEGPVAITYELPKDSRVTIAIDDSNGKRVRNLLPSAERKKGANTDLWDCIDDNGNIVPPGNYTVKGLTHDGLHLKYAGSFASPGNPGWQTADGRGAYYGDHTAPQAVAAGTEFLGLACPMGEAGQHLIGVDMTGQRLWGLANRMFGVSDRISLATDGKILWIASSEGKGRFFIWRCDLKTGAYAAWNLKDKDGKDVLDLQICEKDGGAQCRTISLNDGHLAVIMAADKKILIMNADNGSVEKELKDMPENMAACGYAPDGKLYIVAGPSLYNIDMDAGKAVKVMDGLADPRGIAFDKDGKIFISQRGKKMNVEVFDAQGKKLSAIGKAGGRPEVGFFDENGMLNPAQIAIDSKGRLWVTEENQQPKRTSIWNADTTLAFDLIGTTAYAAGGSINPFDHTRGFSERVEYKLDLAKNKFRPLYTISDALGTGGEWVTQYAKIDGREYIQIRSTARDASMVKIYLRQKDGSWRHAAEWGNVGMGKTMDEAYHKDWNQKFNKPLWEGLFGKAFLWIDKNDDGIAQREEIQTRDIGLGRYYWGQAMGDDLNVVISQAGNTKDFLSFKPQGYTAGGTPNYSFDTMTKITPQGEMGGEGMIAVGRDNRIYLNQSPLQAMATDGKILWTYPSQYVSVHGSHNAPASAPGILIGPSSFYGRAKINDEVGEVFYLNGNLGQNFIFTEDGLWVQSLYNDCRGWFDVPAQAVVGMPCDAMTAGGESFGGAFCKSDDGKFYTLGGGTAAIVMEISGLDSLKRFGQTVSVKAPDIVAAQELKVKRAAQATGKKSYSIKMLQAAPTSERHSDEWDMTKNSIEIQAGTNKIATIKAAYDDKNLYLAYQVNDGSPLKNSGQNEQLMFITGDCVDLMLRTDPAAKDQACVKGDMRLLMTFKDNKPLAVLYEPVAPGAPKEQNASFSSPWRTIPMERVRVVSFPLTMKPVQGGYAVTAAVPLSLLGIDSLKGKVLRGDFGVLGSDSAGQECTSRNYWSNKTTNNTNDVPDEAILTPSLWSELKFE